LNVAYYFYKYLGVSLGSQVGWFTTRWNHPDISSALKPKNSFYFGVFLGLEGRLPIDRLQVTAGLGVGYVGQSQGSNEFDGEEECDLLPVWWSSPAAIRATLGVAYLFHEYIGMYLRASYIATTYSASTSIGTCRSETRVLSAPSDIMSGFGGLRFVF
jgi:hypothetical protein